MLERRKIISYQTSSVLQVKALLFAKPKRTVHMQLKYCPIIFPTFVRYTIVYKRNWFGNSGTLRNMLLFSSFLIT